ncbi:YdcF family protein [Macrococcus animalis]|uniref:YdcF family protein n=1 Tax=Macrococcus animalis TaxID=3395467 RepID=UPI0039BFED88
MKKKLLGIIGALLLLAIIAVGIGVWCYNNVDHGDKPKKSDVIIMIDGGDSGRYTETGRFYEEKYAPKVMISPAIEDKNGLNNVKAVEEAGVPSEAIIKEMKATSTWTNATETLKLMKKNNLKSALVVTSDYHATRTKLAYKRANKDYDYDISVVGVKSKDGLKWNEYQAGKDQAFREAYILPAYWLGLYKIIDL